jgi:filamentous hemagglutinin family protein
MKCLSSSQQNTMKTQFWLSFITLVGLFAGTQIAQAQTYQPTNRAPVSDNTLGTQVSGTGGNFNITGGVNKGQTLFHSFTDFSVPTSGQANFLNPVGNRDIITRVTGNLFSDINGLVNTNGANFFLINPNGIVFGTNAQLNVGKGFVGTTANSIDLVGGGRTITFGTNPSGDAPLLSIAPNVLFDVSRLNFGGGSGAISNFGTLFIPNQNQYIGLIGGNVNINGGQIIAPGGLIELGGLSAVGSTTNEGQLPTNVARADVSLTNGSRLIVSGDGGGDIIISARNLEVLGGSSVIGGIFSGFGTPATVAGDIKINATDNVLIDSFGSQVSNVVAPNGSGQGGNVEINARNLAVTNGAQLAAITAGQGDAGTVKITATGDVRFDGSKDGFGSAAFSTVGQGAVGKGGGVEISARNLAVTNGAQLSASTIGQGDAGSIKITATGDVRFDGRKDGFGSAAFSIVGQGAVGKGGGVEINARNLAVTNGARLSASTIGQGDAGTVKITATGDVRFDGPKDGINSAALSTVEQGAVGKGGGVEINARNLTMTNGAQLSTATIGQGDAGTVKITATGDVSFDNGGIFSTVERGGVGKGGGIEINSRNLSVTNRAQLSTSTFGRGDAGNIKINAVDDVSFRGRGDEERVNITPTGEIFVGNVKFTTIDDFSFGGGLFTGVFSVVLPGAVGKGGEIKINSRNFSMTNRSELQSSSLGQGDAGNIILNTNQISLNNGRIGSISRSFTGGNLDITAQKYLLLRNNSQISTDSSSSGVDSNGGNITINSPLIIAPPGNNDITANALQGNGGNLNITSQGLFGIQFRPKGQDSLTTNDITASSTFGRNGNVNIDTPGTDPGKDSTELPNVTTDASNQISQVCSANTRENKLTVTGRGGLPPNANDPLTSDVVWQDARAASPQPVASSAITNPAKLIPPAVGWVFDGKGKVTLVAAGTQGQPTGTSVICPSTR